MNSLVLAAIRALLVAVVALSVVSCKNPLSTSRGVTYSVGGSASRASMTYSGSNESTLQTGDVTLPWSHSFGARKDDFVYLSAQNAGSTGCVRVTITVDGDELETGQSCGAFVIATVSATLK